ncbi:MAG: ferritin family protein [Deltaproteobacteria bacterium]|nr:ferritin family protein [Deltaproteobacteria bacterium]
MKFKTLDDVLKFAIGKETKSNKLYLMFQKKVKDPAAKKLLSEMADQEAGHRKLLEEALKTHRMHAIGGKCEVADMKLTDYMVERELKPDSDPQDVMMFAMQMEKLSYDFYQELLKNYEGTKLAGAFAKLTDEERCHKETLEKEYEEHFMQWM